MSTPEIRYPPEPFHPSVPPAEPLSSPKHKPGVKASPKDHIPEFSAKIYPPGSAPPDETFKPNPLSEIPNQALNEQVLEDESTYVSPDSTLSGATSKDVDKGLGHPMIGESSAELRHDGQQHRKRYRAGLEGVGASEEGMKLRENNRFLREDDNPPGGRIEEKGVLAEDRFPVDANSLAAEIQGHRKK